MSDQSRQPAGVPSGGQFAPSAKPESSVGLSDPSAAVADLETTMTRVESLLAEHESNHPDDDLFATAEGAHRDDMTPMQALAECHDLWASGAWDDRNAEHDIAEVRTHLERLEAEQRLDEIAPIGESGRRWVDTEDDWHEAERLRLLRQRPVAYTALKVGDRFVLDDSGSLREAVVLGPPGETLDSSRQVVGYVEVRMNNGSERLHSFAEGEMARQVEKPVCLRVDPDNIPTEQQLNEAWGV